MRPSEGASMPPSIDSSVVLPLPLCPTTATNSPAPISRLVDCRATIVSSPREYVLLTFSSLSISDLPKTEAGIQSSGTDCRPIACADRYNHGKPGRECGQRRHRLNGDTRQLGAQPIRQTRSTEIPQSASDESHNHCLSEDKPRDEPRACSECHHRTDLT